VLRAWLRETTDQPGGPLFPSRDGGTLTRDAIERRLAQHVKTARQACPALRSKRVTMHTMRHTAAMNLLTAGVDTSTIALWLGHEQERTTRIYLHADLELKQRTLDRITPPEGRPATEHPTLCSPSSRTYSPPATAPRPKASTPSAPSDALAFRPEHKRFPGPSMLLLPLREQHSRDRSLGTALIVRFSQARGARRACDVPQRSPVRLSLDSRRQEILVDRSRGSSGSRNRG
jgi:hypothetical protein